MFQKNLPDHVTKALYKTPNKFILAAIIILSLFPLAFAQAVNPRDTLKVTAAPGLIDSESKVVGENMKDIDNLPEGDVVAEINDLALNSRWFSRQTDQNWTTPYNSFQEGIEPQYAVTVNDEGTLPLPSSLSGGSLPAGVDPRSLMGGITIDLTYDVVMGFVGSYETVTVTMGTEAYGTAVAGQYGFFWMPLWHNTGGYQVDINCGDSLSITVGVASPIVVVPPCMTGGIDIENDSVYGTVVGDTGGTLIYTWLGYFDINSPSGGNPPAPGSPFTANVTDSNGDFNWLISGHPDLGAESLVAVDIEFDGDVYVRSYLYPDSPVFMVHQYSSIAGYAEIGQGVTVTVYEGAGPGVRWNEMTMGSYPHGFYQVQSFFGEEVIPIEIGDTVEVILDGGPTLSTEVIELGDFSFDTGLETISGTAPDGMPVRASYRQWEINDFVYFDLVTTAGTGDSFLMDFTGAGDLQKRDEVLVVVPDANGNQVQIISGPPFLSAYISLDSNIDCVYGRLVGPGLPIIISVDKGGSEVYSRETGYFSDVGNQTQYCFVIRDAEENLVNFDPGDLVTLTDGGFVEVASFTWSGDTTTNHISGTSPDGEINVHAFQWQNEWYPELGDTTFEIPVVSGNFDDLISSGFDVRDGIRMEFTHFGPFGSATQTNNFSYTPTLPFFELQLPYGIGGMVGSPGELVEAWLYDTDGTTLLSHTIYDQDEDPYRYWLGDFDGHLLETGYRVEVSTSSGWSADMIVPDLSIAGDMGADLLTAQGPEGLLFLEVNNNDAENPDGISQFVPADTGVPVDWDLSLLPWDLVPSDTIAVTYQAEDGNRARLQETMAEVSEVNLWLDFGANDWMWGSAEPYSIVTAVRDSITLFTAYADPACGGCWEIEDPLDINPGDLITVSAGAEAYPVDVEIPTPLSANADAETDVVSGQIGGWEESVEVHGNWWGGYQEVTASGGSYSAIYSYIPNGADGYIRFSNMSNWATIGYHQYFREPNLLMDVNYSHDWIEGSYPPGYDVELMVTESDGETSKGTAEMVTGEIPWWGGGTGFSTSLGDPWLPEPPDIQEGDWVFGEVDVGGTIYSNAVKIGAITGEVDSNAISGTINASWLPQDIEVQVYCHPNAEGVEGKEDWVLPNGIDEYLCEWVPGSEWDIPPNQQIGVSYRDPGGYVDPDENPVPGNNWVYNVFTYYTDELIMRIHYDHEWIEGFYEPEHTITLEVYDSQATQKADLTVPTGPIDDWGGQSGFATYLEGVSWNPGQPDIQPFDVIHGEVDDGSLYWADVEIGEIIGIPDLAGDSISGTVDADWLMPGPVDVVCSIWEEGGIEIYTTVIPNGEDTYDCDFSGQWDLQPGTNLMVSYFEPDGHQVIGDFSPPAPYLTIEKSLIGEGSPGEGGNAAFYIQYQNQGDAPADDVLIIDTLDGMDYFNDTSGLPVTVQENQITWDLGTLGPGMEGSFVLYAQVASLEGSPVGNTVEISTSNEFDMGEPWEKISTWEGMVAGGDTHLNVGKETWTGNPAPGEDFVYQVNVCNNGSTSSSLVTLTDTLPGATSFVYWWSADVGWVGDYPTDYITNYSIPPGTCSEVYIRVTLDSGANPGDELINHVEISASDDLETEDNTAELHHQVGDPYVDLGIWHNWYGGSLVPGGYYCYGLSYRNEGNVAVTGPVDIIAALPEGVTLGSSDLTPSFVSDETVIWQLAGEIIAGQEGEIGACFDIDGSVLVDTVLVNTADIDIQNGEENTDNNHSEIVEIVNDHGPNLRVQKQGGWDGEEGQFAWWQIRVENIGDETVADVVLTDYYPDGMELEGGVNVDYGEPWEWYDNDPEDNAFSVYLDRLEPGWNLGMNYRTYVRGDVTLVPLMEFTNAVNVPLPSDIDMADNWYENILIFIGPRPHLQIQKWLIGEGSLGVGSNAAYYVEYQNQGELAAENVEITDVLEGMDYISDTSAFSTSIDGNQVTWDIGTVNPGDWVGFTVFAEVTAPVDDPISNTVWIATTTPYDEGDESEKTSTWEGVVVPNDIDLNVGKVTWTQNPAPGEDFVYQINICNNGSTSSSTVTMTDTLPDAVAFVYWWSEEPGWTDVSQVGQTLVISYPSISSWNCSTVYVQVTVDPLSLPGDGLTNHVEITTANDINPGDNTAEIYHEVGEPFIDLATWQNWHNGSLTPEGVYHYGLAFKNEGNVTVSGPVEITATLPEDVTFVESDLPPESVIDNVVTWLVDDLISGVQVIIDVTIEIDSEALPGTMLTHLAEIEIQPGEENTGNNSSTLEEIVQSPGPNLRVRKSGEWQGNDMDYYAWYELRVENIGDETVNDVVVTDTFPAGMSLRNGPHVDFGEGWDCDVYAEEFSCTLSRLDPGWNIGIYFELTPDIMEPGVIYTNTVEVTPLAGDTNTDDNISVFVLFSGPDMKIEKTLVDGAFYPDQEVTFLLRFGNAYTDGGWWGNPWWWGMHGNAIITDTLPEGMSYVSAFHHWCGEDDWSEYDPTIIDQELIWTHDPLGYYNCFEILLTAAIESEIYETNTLVNLVMIESDLPGEDVDPYPENNVSEYVPVLDFDAPEITSADNTTFTVGSAGSFTITTTGVPIPGIVYIGSLPVGVDLLDNGDGTATLSGTPTIATGGSYEIEITASNGILPNDVQTFYLTVNEAPIITSADAVTFEVGSYDSFIITATGYPLPDISYTGSLPGGINFTDNGDGTATIDGTPVPGTGGIYALMITASNSTLIDDEQEFTLTVEEAPEITSADNTTFTVGSAGSFTITTTGNPIPGIVYVGSLPVGVDLLDNGDGTATLSGTPSVGTEGVYEFTITASNGVLPNDTQTFTLTIEEGTSYIFLPLILR